MNVYVCIYLHHILWLDVFIIASELVDVLFAIKIICY